MTISSYQVNARLNNTICFVLYRYRQNGQLSGPDNMPVNMDTLFNDYCREIKYANIENQYAVHTFNVSHIVCLIFKILAPRIERNQRLFVKKKQFEKVNIYLFIGNDYFLYRVSGYHFIKMSIFFYSCG